MPGLPEQKPDFSDPHSVRSQAPFSGAGFNEHCSKDLHGQYPRKGIDKATKSVLSSPVISDGTDLPFLDRAVLRVDVFQRGCLP